MPRSAGELYLSVAFLRQVRRKDCRRSVTEAQRLIRIAEDSAQAFAEAGHQAILQQVSSTACKSGSSKPCAASSVYLMSPPARPKVR